MSRISIATGLFFSAEIILLYFKNIAMRIVNNYFAVSQMAIESGYKYGEVVKVLEDISFVFAIIPALIYLVYIIIEIRKGNN